MMAILLCLSCFAHDFSQRVCYVAEHIPWSGTPSESAQVYAYYKAEGRTDSWGSGHHLNSAFAFGCAEKQMCCNLTCEAGLGCMLS